MIAQKMRIHLKIMNPRDSLVIVTIMRIRGNVRGTALIPRRPIASLARAKLILNSIKSSIGI